MNYEPVRRAYSVLPTLLGIAEFGLGGPENAAMGGGALHAAGPVTRLEEGAGALMTREQALAAARQEVERLNALRRPGAEKGLDPNAPFAQYAREYPPVPEPVIAKDIQKNKEYLARGESPETIEALDKLSTVNKQLADQGVRTWQNPSGWKPFFDPEQRFYGDTSKYPTPEPIEASMPTREWTKEIYRAKIQTPENIDRARKDVEIGLGLKDPKTGLPARDKWYAVGQLQKALIDEMGEKAGLQRFKDIADGMAGTTSGATPETNLRSTMYGLFLRNHGRPVPTGPDIAGETGIRSYAMPVPTSGERLAQNMKKFDEIINKGEALTMENPKRLSFSSNLQGHQNMATIDQQATQGITPDFQSRDVFHRGQWGKVDKKTGKFTPGEISHPNAPPGDSYFAYDEVMDKLAKEFGMSKANVQAMHWVGKKYREEGEISAPMIQEINNMIERTARLTKRSPEEVFRKGFAYKKAKSAIPLYGFLGAIGAGAAAAADEQKQGGGQ